MGRGSDSHLMFGDFVYDDDYDKDAAHGWQEDNDEILNDEWHFELVTMELDVHGTWQDEGQQSTPNSS